MDCTQDFLYSLQGPSKRLKPDAEDGENGLTTTQNHLPIARGAGHPEDAAQRKHQPGTYDRPSVDIEDLHDLQCGLVCAPTVPTQTEEEYPLAQANACAEDEARDGFHFLPSNPRDLPRRRELPRSALSYRPKFPSTSRPSLRLRKQRPAPDSGSQCLLERVNPDYFERDKYKWHSSMEQVPATLGTTSIDPESAQDFTAIYTSDKTTLQEKMLQFDYQCAPGEQDWALPELDTESLSSRSAHSSPDALLHSLPFETQDPDASLFEVNALDDVNQMFDWDEACAALVDDEIPDYHMNELATHRSLPYNASAFRSIPSIMRMPYGLQSATTQAPGAYASTDRILSPHEQEDGPSAFETFDSSPSHVADEEEPPATVCHNCNVTKTPLWRRTPDKRHSLCNACGLYLKQYKTMRPLLPRNRSQSTKRDEDNIVCANCEATKTSLWRKDEGGQVICNACGLYHKLHGKSRPVTMRKEKISRRKRYRNLAPEALGGSSTAVSGSTPVIVPQQIASLPQAPDAIRV